jgi:signal transduction histidine kinase
MGVNNNINLIILLILLNYVNLVGQEILALNDTASEYYVGKLFYILHDPGGKLTINDVASGRESKDFKKANSTESNFGHTSDVIWIRLSIKNEAINTSGWLIHEDYSLIDKVELFIPADHQHFTELVAGIDIPIRLWPINNRQIIFPFHLNAGAQKTFYIRFESQLSLPVYLRIWKPETFAHKTANNNLVFGIFYGALVIMAMYNLFLFFSVKDLSYLYYFLYALSVGYYQFSMDGLSNQFLSTASIWANFRLQLSSLGFAALFWTVFAKKFLEISKYSSALKTFYKYVIGICIIYIILLVTTPIRIMAFSTASMWMCSILINALSAIYCWRKGNNLARIYLIAILFFIIGAVLRAGRILGIEQESLFTESGMLIGILVEMLILSFALGNRINTIKRTEEKEKALIRGRIASDLHDEIGSNLSSIFLTSQMLKKSSCLHESEKKQLEEMETITKETIESIRDIIWFINPGHDKTDDLIFKMRDIASKLFQNLEYTFDASENKMINIKDLRFRRNLFLIYKEILHNIVEHSKASQIQIKLNESKDELRLEVADNGIGFDEMMVDYRHGEGINNLKKRSNEIGGLLNISSRPGKGTLVLLRVRI